MPTLRFLQQSLSQAAAAKGRRANALAPLNWPLSLLTVATTTLIAGDKGTLALIPGLLLVGIVIFYCYAYFYLMKSNPDHLRSETYSLSKLAIEKGMIGDNRVGMLQMTEDGTVKIGTKPSPPTVVGSNPDANTPRAQNLITGEGNDE